MLRYPAIICCLLMLTVQTAWSQEEPEYRLELGVGGGLTSYQGDLNESLTKGLQPIGGVVAKYKMNPRMAWTAMLGVGKLKGSSKGAKTVYPDPYNTPLEFKSTLTDFSLRYEYNFWAFGTGKEYRGAKPLAPFITMGLGLSFAKPDNAASTVGGQMMIGLGAKYKLGDRWNLAAEWVMHFTGSDKLDGMADPYGINSEGLFKNTDCYSVLALTVTYDLWAKCKACQNDKD